MITIVPLLVLLAEPVAAHPYAPAGTGPRTVDLRTHRASQPLAEQPSFHDLDDYMAPPQPVPTQSRPGTLPDGWVQQGNTVVPAGVADGTIVIEPETIFAVEDIPGNKYPRKHTLYMNFTGGDLVNGKDNSAENKSTLAKMGPYPVYTGGEAKAIAAVQGVQTDVANFGIRVVYLERPPKILPYTMAMIGGSWTDTNLEDPAGGVAPTADCGALGQRHVVYVFADGGWSATAIANVTSQEAGHGWGLDHNLNCGSVMSYCGGGDGVFSGTCDGLCENQCQGAAGCRLTHEMFCGVGNDQQNEQAELSWIFGGNEPDVEPPTVEIVEPADGSSVADGANVNVRAIVDDNYGGFGWKFLIEKDGEVLYDEVDYDREVDAEYRAAVNLVNLDPGEYSVTVDVLDHGDLTATDTISFTVMAGAGTDGGDSADGTDDGAADAGSSADGGTDSGADDGDDDGGDSDESGGGGSDGGLDGGDPPERGCNCNAAAPVDPDAAAWLGVLVVMGGLVRRRSA